MIFGQGTTSSPHTPFQKEVQWKIMINQVKYCLQFKKSRNTWIFRVIFFPVSSQFENIVRNAATFSETKLFLFIIMNFRFLIFSNNMRSSTLCMHAMLNWCSTIWKCLTPFSRDFTEKQLILVSNVKNQLLGQYLVDARSGSKWKTWNGLSGSSTSWKGQIFVSVVCLIENP